MFFAVYALDIIFKIFKGMWNDIMLLQMEIYCPCIWLSASHFLFKPNILYIYIYS